MVRCAICAGLYPNVAGVGTRDAALIVLFAPYLDAPTAAVLGILCTLRYLIPGLAGLCLYRLEPVVSGFLQDMVQTLGEAQQMRDVEREENMRATIANAESVGRNIKFISFNASIEAARIGDMGKGFAVIATEIRELSGKTQGLLEEISGYLKH